MFPWLHSFQDIIHLHCLTVLGTQLGAIGKTYWGVLGFWKGVFEEYCEASCPTCLFFGFLVRLRAVLYQHTLSLCWTVSL